MKKATAFITTADTTTTTKKRATTTTLRRRRHRGHHCYDRRIVSYRNFRTSQWDTTPDMITSSSSGVFLEDSVSSSSLLSSPPIVEDTILGTTTEDILSTEDILVGIVLAISLALLGSYLQSRRNQNDFVLWSNNYDNKDDNSLRSNDNNITYSSSSSEDTTTATSTKNKVFGEEDWEKISQPENYILYSTKVRKQLKKQKEDNENTSSVVVNNVQRTEKKYVVIALLVLFVPIFGFEFFLSLSRQIICGGFLPSQTEWAQQLCSAHVE
mmetsp:Transcript_18160/g.20966  ORF Transcript_18160/g.20966 Transcript_18160/m.20966 type:complete len:269 (+) Transcript_18160:102-908(+)